MTVFLATLAVFGTVTAVLALLAMARRRAGCGSGGLSGCGRGCSGPCRRQPPNGKGD